MIGTLRGIEPVLLGASTAGYALACLAYLGAWRKPSATRRWLGTGIAWGAFLSHAGWFAARSYRAQHLPIYTGHEFSATFAGGIVLAYLIFEAIHRRRELGIFVLPVAVALLGHAWSLSRSVEPLIPIFQSLWLEVHIVTAFVAYSAFAVTFGASCLVLLRHGRSARDGGPDSAERLTSIDRIAYRSTTIGFSFLSICIVSGAVWAEYVWGRFWSWDPKETWSLITWLIMAAYLHTRYHRGWRDRRAAYLGIAGFVLVLVTYVGVDYLSPRQHAFLLWERL